MITQETLNNYIEKTLKIFCVFSFVFGFYYLITRPIAGDDIMFVENLDLIKTEGWYAAIASKISVPFLILAYPFSLLFSNAFALRLVNVLLFIVLCTYFYKRGAIKNTSFYYLFLFYSSTGWFVTATNDALFVVVLVIFFNEVYKLLTKEEGSLVLVWTSIIITFFTRELVIVYLPVIFISLLLLYKKGYNLFKFNYITFAVLLFLIFINVPSIIENKTLSYDNKIPPKEVKTNWAQRQYLAQLMVNEGKLPHGQHPSWEETDSFVQKNGENSLPKTLFRGMLFDYKLTIKEFFKDCAEVLFVSIRQTGIVLIFIICNLFFLVFKRKIDWSLYIPLISFMMISIFSLIIISFVETRWLIPIFIMAILYYSDIIQKNKIYNRVNTVNSLLTILVICYGIYKIVLKV